MGVAAEEVALSVVIPTIGRPALLDVCLRSIAACTPRAAEVIVVDQSHSPDIAAVVERWSAANARLLPCAGTGFARGTNAGVRASVHGAVMVTNDDCTVAPDWVARAWDALAAFPSAIVTGQVRAGTDPDRTPSTITRPEAVDMTGDVDGAELYPGNMVVPRDLFLGLGGFDERPTLAVAAEDNDFCYRWIRAGGELRYDPMLVVWHHDWRTEEELIDRYVVYGRGEGAFIAKHLHAGDLYVLRFLIRDFVAGGRSLVSAVVRGRKRWSDPRRGFLRGLPVGLARGWAEARRIGRAPRAGRMRIGSSG